MVTRKYFEGIDSVIIKTDKVFNDVQQAVFLENAFKESCKIRKGLGFHVAVFCLARGTSLQVAQQVSPECIGLAICKRQLFGKYAVEAVL